MDHELLLYEDDERLVDAVTPFLTNGVDAGEEVVTVLDARKLDVVRDALGAPADQVTWLEVDAHYTRPLAAIAGYDASIRALVSRGAPRVRLFGELPRVVSRAQGHAWIAYDAIINRAFAHHPVSIMCGYDGRVVPAWVREGVLCCHPEIHGEGPNTRFDDPVETVRAHTPEPEAVDGLEPVPTGTARDLRRALVAAMARAGLGPHAIDGMVLAANEVLANARRHGGGETAVRIGRAGAGFVCEIADGGGGFDDPLAGYLPPHGDGAGGGGLWTARQCTARLEVMRRADGTTVRLWA
jgi:anti-sigma regulatory factor (Ser/Thr protein kinase)